MRVDIEQLSDQAHVWIFGVSPALDANQSGVVMRAIDAFLDQWSSHGVPIRAARDLREGSFLVIAADAASERSGCSIDRMFGTLRRLEQQLGVTILDSNRIFLRDSDGVRAVSRGAFRDTATPETPVFDTTSERLGELRSGRWERAAAESWHQRLLA